MISRVTDPAVVADALSRYPGHKIELDVEEWIAHPSALALIDDAGNVALFEQDRPGVFYGHFFFLDKGRKAKELSINILRMIFGEYGAKAVKGLTPLDNRAAIWMTRHLGFKDYGEVDTWVGKHVLFIMTKDEFVSRYEA